jgi:hypothetical protein
LYRERAELLPNLRQVVEWRRHHEQRLRLAALGFGEALLDLGCRQRQYLEIGAIANASAPGTRLRLLPNCLLGQLRHGHCNLTGGNPEAAYRVV